MHVYKQVQSLSIRKGTNKCESAPAQVDIPTYP